MRQWNLAIELAVVGIPTWLYFIIKACPCVALSRAGGPRTNPHRPGNRADYP